MLQEPLFLCSWKLAGQREQQVHSLSFRKSSWILSGRNFLLHTGASISVCPQPICSSSGAAHSPAGSLHCFDDRPPLKFGSCSFQWSFCLAPVTMPTLGSDFLRNFSLLVYVAGERVLDADSLDI